MVNATILTRSHYSRVGKRTDLLPFVHVIMISHPNSIRVRSVQPRPCKVQSKTAESGHTDLLLQTDLRWLNRGKFLKKFQESVAQIISFLEERSDNIEMLLKNE